jgi:hypothetical protein
MSPLEDPTNVQFDLVDDEPDENETGGMTQQEAEDFLASVPIQSESE